jgi:cytochrome c oxidase subunit 1
VHLPSPSYWPLVLAAGLPLIGYGLIFNLGIAAVGGVVVLLAGYAWGLEPADDPEAAHGHGHDDHGSNGHDDGGDGHDGDGEAAEPLAVSTGQEGSQDD